MYNSVAVSLACEYVCVSLEIILGKMRDVREYHGPCSTRVPSRKEQLVVGVTNPSNSWVFWSENFKFHKNPRKTMVNVAIRKNSTLLADFIFILCGLRIKCCPATHPKFNIAPEKLPPNRKVVFQPPFFRGYVKLGGCT